MSQNDMTIDNSTGANVRADINSALQAIATNNSGSSAPSTTFASQFFADTNASILKLRNTSNNGYVNLFNLDGSLVADKVVTASILDDAVTQAKVANDAIGADELASNAVVNASVASGAAIAGTKISPDFGSQTVQTTGTVQTPSINEGQLGNRRLTINGAMTIAQRGDVSSVTSGYGGADRYKFDSSGAAVVTLKQDTGDITQGFAKAQRIDVTTADSSLAAGDYALLSYRFEGQDLQQLKKGTANAQQVTLSFHIKSPKTGTHIVELVDQSNSARHVNKAYTVNVANTYEKKTITFPMETSNTITNDNARGMDLNWWLAAGSTYSSGTLQTNWGADTNANRAVGQVNCMDSTSNDIFITGVQLEVGSVATEFEHPRSFAQELQLCKRYFQFAGGAHWGATEGSTNYRIQVQLEPEMRASPTVTVKSGGVFNTRYQGSDVAITNPTKGATAIKSRYLWTTVTSSGLTGGKVLFGRSANADADYLSCDAEL